MYILSPINKKLILDVYLTNSLIIIVIDEFIYTDNSNGGIREI